jgi:uncharacterized protein
MTFAIEILLLVTLSLAACLGLAINVVGMPGNWLIVLLAAGSYFFVPTEKSLHVSFMSVALILGAAALGELLEFSAGALGASRLGASHRSNALAIVGSIIGAIFGLFAGSIIPIPIIGQMVGSLLFGSIGAAVGAVGGERWVGKTWDASFQVGEAAFWGRLLGTVGKAGCGAVAAAVYVLAIWR